MMKKRKNTEKEKLNKTTTINKESKKTKKCKVK